MEYNRIVAVTGLPGLYEILGSKSDGAIVRSLDDKSTRFVSSRVHNLSHLESIEVYTVRDNVNLVDVFLAMQNDSTALPDVKDNKALKGYFEKVYPDMDFERVYTSDLKKMVKWYEILKSNGVAIKLAEAEEGDQSEENEPVEAVAEEPKPAAKKKTSKKTAAEEDKVALKVSADEAPEVADVAKPKRSRKKKEENKSEE